MDSEAMWGLSGVDICHHASPQPRKPRVCTRRTSLYLSSHRRGCFPACLWLLRCSMWKNSESLRQRRFPGHHCKLNAVENSYANTYENNSASPTHSPFCLICVHFITLTRDSSFLERASRVRRGARSS